MSRNAVLQKLSLHGLSPIVQRGGRRNRGGAVAEAAAAMALLLPLLVLLMMAITQISEYFVLRQQVAYVARQAAHEIAYAYGNLGYTGMNSNGASSGPANTSDANYSSIVNNISVPGVMNQNSGTQISTYFNIPNSPSLSRSYVQVSVTYQSGPNLPKFPWNPLKTGFDGFNLAGVKVVSACCWPIAH